MAEEKIEVTRTIPFEPEAIFAVLTDPQGHVAIDASGMLMDAEGERITKAGDEFLVHMDREALGDVPLGHYDVTVVIERFTENREIAWSILGTVRPAIGHIYGYRLEPAENGTVVTSYYDWSAISDEWRARGIFPVIAESSLKATLGVLERAVRRGYPRATAVRSAT
ncbi:MAG TPA: SRPBCC family protein [Pseudonocardiaceae bacterium]|nr:SRPBCC family protein [Pseudonocardiaceae bacterium]